MESVQIDSQKELINRSQTPLNWRVNQISHSLFLKVILSMVPDYLKMQLRVKVERIVLKTMTASEVWQHFCMRAS